jgi:hypothetical protein
MVVNPRNKTEIFLAKKPLDTESQLDTGLRRQLDAGRESPLEAELRRQLMAFFGWPFLGQTQPKIAGNPGQPQPDPPPTAEVFVYDVTGAVARHVEDESLKLWIYTGGRANQDFRMTLIGGLQKLVPDGSILIMTREPITGFDYRIELYPPGHPSHSALLSECDRELPGGRRYGWRDT